MPRRSIRSHDVGWVLRQLVRQDEGDLSGAVNDLVRMDSAGRHGTRRIAHELRGNIQVTSIEEKRERGQTPSLAYVSDCCF